MREERKVYNVLVGKPEGKRPLGRPRCRWEELVRMEIMETGWGCVGWIQSVQGINRCQALVNMAMNLRVLAPRN
jgi:hypothetical protein